MASYTGLLQVAQTPTVGRTASQLVEANGGLGVGTSYVNRAWDPTAVDFVRWTTADAADAAGASYPGPDIFGNVTDYCVEATL